MRNFLTLAALLTGCADNSNSFDSDVEDCSTWSNPDYLPLSPASDCLFTVDSFPGGGDVPTTVETEAVAVRGGFSADAFTWSGDVGHPGVAIVVTTRTIDDGMGNTFELPTGCAWVRCQTVEAK